MTPNILLSDTFRAMLPNQSGLDLRDTLPQNQLGRDDRAAHRDCYDRHQESA